MGTALATYRLTIPFDTGFSATNIHGAATVSGIKSAIVVQVNQWIRPEGLLGFKPTIPKKAGPGEFQTSCDQTNQLTSDYLHI